MGSLRFIASANTNSGSSTSPISFTSIPSTYTDLLVYLSLKSTASGTEQFSRFYINNVANQYHWQRAQGAGLSISVDRTTSSQPYWTFIVPGGSAPSAQFSNTFIYIPNYKNTSIYKSPSVSSNQTNSNTNNRNTFEMSGWSGITAAINRIDIQMDFGDIAQFCTMYLYGIDSTP